MSSDGTPRPLVSDFLSDAEMDRLAGVLVGVMISAEKVRARRRAAEGATVEDSKPATTARIRRLKPSRLAQWEAHWQAEQEDAEAER